MRKDLHQNQNPQISVAEALEEVRPLIIDVRSPKEYEEGRIPGSVNLPLLDDLERHLIGILYKQTGPEEAIRKGYEVFEPKQTLWERQLAQLPQDRPWAVLCARGGMRSQVATNFIRQKGYPARQVQGGYKSYRNYCLEQFSVLGYPNLTVIQGQTGVGKTEVIRGLSNSLDLEGMANHRGSMFGAVGLTPRSQKNFEGLLLERLQAVDWSRPVFVEGESRKIGPVSIPAPLFSAMAQAPTILLTAPLVERAARITKEYVLGFPDRLGEVRTLVGKLFPDLGHKRVEELLEWFDRQQFQQCFEAVLAQYYDVKYNHSLSRMTFVAELENRETEATLQTLEAWRLP
ncbi:MAG: tRNA 2-selenouridine(34) synthase MnmH [Candidatus Lambdaproteobacteria bacterium RIFOXYD1_FULL_56_27]|uniref:tRNA 2-selenouridine(34) synthase MnmH n=1 Tax=Candidatus Lambdaproteobacteria bacterium RIFOXYD2_FULL_56_26 TaxID=1817773 RepID=A0A1F6GLD2_9PROT|nr:MAG: tRNA 2-selenouridine(34) synthase MnmH [Candidatus Lambdaproteobacteria bacterium RIFOXYD2_FULL_56_26]OGH05473.1 MAG: tRNA 2-selenouridine(34) synthase MnmH [Candidatus Lambdaproteobacteria bacterium RIFOXYC1_FULL_56_13]OGH09764.1 MAG: tRNA 2-selenouridine(34) synthase MnmH [Candidatus Lambdaproteobacteria bacterium RIFOXYD1_FULL_56_27]